jgi:hypothetical protein
MVESRRKPSVSTVPGVNGTEWSINVVFANGRTAVVDLFPPLPDAHTRLRSKAACTSFFGAATSAVVQKAPDVLQAVRQSLRCPHSIEHRLGSVRRLLSCYVAASRLRLAEFWTANCGPRGTQTAQHGSLLVGLLVVGALVLVPNHSQSVASRPPEPLNVTAKGNRLSPIQREHDADPIGELIDRLSRPQTPTLPATFLSVTVDDVKNAFLAMSQRCDSGAMGPPNQKTMIVPPKQRK